MHSDLSVLITDHLNGSLRSHHYFELSCLLCTSTYIIVSFKYVSIIYCRHVMLSFIILTYHYSMYICSKILIMVFWGWHTFSCSIVSHSAICICVVRGTSARWYSLTDPIYLCFMKQPIHPLYDIMLWFIFNCVHIITLNWAVYFTHLLVSSFHLNIFL